MKLTFRHALACAAFLALGADPALAQAPKFSDNVIRIGVLSDLSGAYSAIGGMKAVDAVRMAADDFMKDNPGIKVEVLAGDHQNKADVAAAKARDWFDNQGVDMITDLVTTSVAFAVMEIAKQKNKIVIATGPASFDITGSKCTPVSVHYVYDTYALANGTGQAIVKQGGDSWFFVTVDYAFGHALEKDTSDAVKAAGGKVLGAVRAPLNTADFSSYLLQAQASGAKVIGLANAGNDFHNSIKTASDFGISAKGKQQMVGLLVFITDIHSMGLQAAQGLMFTTAWYWDLNEESRKFAKRVYDKTQRMPTQIEGGRHGRNERGHEENARAAHQ